MEKNMKRVQEKEKYWEERLNINIREEFYIYLYLCEGVTVKKKMLPMEKQFQTYKNWKEHIINILEKVPLDEQEEFWRYLNYRKRVMASNHAIIDNFLYPVVVGFLSAYLLEFVVKAGKWSELNGIADVIGNIFGILLFIFLLSIFLRYIMNLLRSEWNKANQEKCFYEDFMEIVDGIRKRKS